VRAGAVRGGISVLVIPTGKYFLDSSSLPLFKTGSDTLGVDLVFLSEDEILPPARPLFRLFLGQQGMAPQEAGLRRGFFFPCFPAIGFA